jgi:hypothetical protein
MVEDIFNGPVQPAETFYVHPKDNYIIGRNRNHMITLQARHSTGKEVALRGNTCLKRFLEELAALGMGCMREYEDVKYKFVGPCYSPTYPVYGPA